MLSNSKDQTMKLWDIRMFSTEAGIKVRNVDVNVRSDKIIHLFCAWINTKWILPESNLLHWSHFYNKNPSYCISTIVVISLYVGSKLQGHLCYKINFLSLKGKLYLQAWLLIEVKYKCEHNVYLSITNTHGTENFVWIKQVFVFTGWL